jgi:hypothetical protein
MLTTHTRSSNEVVDFRELVEKLFDSKLSAIGDMYRKGKIKLGTSDSTWVGL